VIATCSPRNFHLVKSLGADLVIDYKSPNAITDIRTFTNNSLSLIFDCIGESGAPEFCYEAFGPKGGKYSTLLFPVEPPRKNIKVTMVMAYNSYGQTFHKFGKEFPAVPEEYAFAAKFFAICERFLAEGKLKTHPIDHRQGGLAAIPEGYKDLMEGKVSGKKLVYTVS
jgi:NADPH:quinone reductase-like Zn-dependent oxidoreductase